MNINYISAIGLAISILFLLISCSIFTFSSALKSGRVVMHNNLCLSLLASSVFWLVWHFTVLGQHQVWAGNSVWCRLLHVLTTYLTISNYTWMLCEGAYLHCLLTIPFIEEEMLIKILRVFGWVSPSIFIIPYCVYRSYHEVRLRPAVNKTILNTINRITTAGWILVTVTGSSASPSSSSSFSILSFFPTSSLFRGQNSGDLLKPELE